MLRLVFPEARRGSQFKERGKQADVEGTPFWIECKKRKGYPGVLAALAQSEADTDGRLPIAITMQDRTAPIVSLYLRDFVALCEKHGIYYYTKNNV
jgi:hypothetical protein